MRSRAVVALVLVALALAGCARRDALGEAEAAHAGVTCPAGQFVAGFGADGAPTCAAPAVAGVSCAEGSFVSGFGPTGHPTCGAPPAPTAPVAPSLLKVLSVFGERNDTSSPGLWDLAVQVELPARADAVDLREIILRVSHANETRLYAWSSTGIAKGGAPSGAFSAEWIRGDGAPLVGEGDLVALRFNANGPALLPRETVELSLVSDRGTVRADFRTPPTYGSDTVITLR